MGLLIPLVLGGGILAVAGPGGLGYFFVGRFRANMKIGELMKPYAAPGRACGSCGLNRRIWSVCPFCGASRWTSRTRRTPESITSANSVDVGIDGSAERPAEKLAAVGLGQGWRAGALGTVAAAGLLAVGVFPGTWRAPKTTASTAQDGSGKSPTSVALVSPVARVSSTSTETSGSARTSIAAAPDSAAPTTTPTEQMPGTVDTAERTGPGSFAEVKRLYLDNIRRQGYLARPEITASHMAAPKDPKTGQRPDAKTEAEAEIASLVIDADVVVKNNVGFTGRKKFGVVFENLGDGRWQAEKTWLFSNGQQVELTGDWSGLLPRGRFGSRLPPGANIPANAPTVAVPMEITGSYSMVSDNLTGDRVPRVYPNLKLFVAPDGSVLEAGDPPGKGNDTCGKVVEVRGAAVAHLYYLVIETTKPPPNGGSRLLHQDAGKRVSLAFEFKYIGEGAGWLGSWKVIRNEEGYWPNRYERHAERPPSTILSQPN